MPQARIIQLIAVALASVACVAGVAFAAQRRALTPSQSDVIFDEVSVGSTSAPQQVTITNGEQGPVRIARSVIVGPHARDFLLATDTCSGELLDGGDQCKVAIRFRPTAKGTRVAHLKIPHDGDGCTLWLTLAGSGPNQEPSARTAGCEDDNPPAANPSTGSSTSGSAGSTHASTGGLANSALRLPASARSCKSRRVFRIRINPPRGVRFTKVTVRLNKKLISVRRGKRVTASVSLRGLPRGRFTLRVVATTAFGRKLSRTRHYVTCVKSRG